MRPLIFMQHGHWSVRAFQFEVTLSFASFEGACRWAKRIAD